MLFEPLLTSPPTRPRRGSADDLREALLELARGRAMVIAHSEKRWASITFTGARHRLELAFEGAGAIEAGELFIALMPEHEFAIPDQLVADASVTEVDHRLDPPSMRVICELLLLEES